MKNPLYLLLSLLAYGFLYKVTGFEIAVIILLANINYFVLMIAHGREL